MRWHPSSKQFNLQLPQRMVGLLGPNGAGKSTLMPHTKLVCKHLTKAKISLPIFNSLKQAHGPFARKLGYLPTVFLGYIHI